MIQPVVFLDTLTRAFYPHSLATAFLAMNARAAEVLEIHTMNRPPRFLALTLAVTVSLASFSAWAPAEDAPDAAKAPAGDPALRESVETFWHYGKIARYDLAAEEAKKIIAKGSEPTALLDTFEKVAVARKDNLEQWMLRWQGVDALRDPVTQLISIQTQAHRARRSDPKYIERNLRMMAEGDRPRVIALGRLRETGELAAPTLINYLKDPNKREFHGFARQVLRELGRSALGPLVAATETKDNDLLVQVVGALGDLGYDSVVPYLTRIANGKQASESARQAAANALATIGAGPATALNAADQFYDLAEKFYYRKASIVADNREPSAYVWYWDESNGLTKKDVPAAIFNDIMAMRSAEYALKIGGGKGDALSLWLAADYKREADLPTGATDATRAENEPAAHFYGVSAGTQYLNAVLTRASKDHESGVAIRAVKSLQEIVGQSNLFNGAESQPLLDALAFPDRQVRYEAALALAGALPQKPFAGQEQVVPLLAEALGQTGTANALLLMPSQDQVNSMSQALKGIGYGTVGATTAETAVAAAAGKPSIDVVIISEESDPKQIDQLMRLLSGTARLNRVAKVVVTKNVASSWTQAAASDPLLTATQATDGAGLKPVLDKARMDSGTLPIDDATATKYALRSAEMLSKLAITRGQVLDLNVAEGTVLGALEDSRPEVVKAVGNVAGLYGSKTAQDTLANKALDEKTSDELKVSLFKSLAVSAKFNGNHLDAGAVSGLVKLVTEGKNAEVRSAAAEAMGALNLPSDQARTLIVNQSKT